ncbi:ATP-dependent helicase HrpB [Echinicola jeungdonensis]|uniref:ATP-dependent helicase HrpB n=1 Tax=Echinicola jeungdonensis TaxID=709343 RepID=A0ABV5J5F1_9BACT|nr:ATP-dependent helicase HrpB [Echinicola jeungdonensis]MDN3670852.1 ATP-dependent helicase HrpB [Echinicola jeungdonensis]
MAFHPKTIDLPVVEILPQAREKLSDHNTLILNAPPGAGKSTVVPLALLEELWLAGKKILMLEPRRLAAKSIAKRMADLLGEDIGKNVGFRIRFENQTTSQTRIEVLTEGILTRMIHNDNALEDVGLVIFDEFHERNIHADVAMALCREVQQILRPDLRILVMSATLDLPLLSQLLEAPIVESKGKQYPVNIIHTHETDEWSIPESTASIIQTACTEQHGDILAFLPGQGEIKKCEDILKTKLPQMEICPLFGQLPLYQQQKAIFPHPKGKRKVVLATSIAETSLTIEGIHTVVDSGFGRSSLFDPRSGLSRLVTTPITKDAADQRAGRAGRLGPGTCYRLWTRATEDRMKPFRVPEILEADLASLFLDLVQWGIDDINKMTWLTPPPQGALNQARELLEELGAISEGKITSHGKLIRDLPCHPRIAHMLIKAKGLGKLPLATDIAALLDERDPLDKEMGTDFNLRLEALRRHRDQKRKGKKLAKIEMVAGNYRKLFRIEIENVSFDHLDTGLLLTYAYPERIAHARPGNNAQFQLTNGKLAMMSHLDHLAHEPWICISHIDARDGMGKIFMAAPLDPEYLAPMVKEQEVVNWETHKGGFIAEKQWRIGHIVLKKKPLKHFDPSLKEKAIYKAIQNEGERLLNFDKEVEQFQNRINSLRIWRPDENWPDLSSGAITKKPDMLIPYIQGIEKPEDLKKLDLKKILFHDLPFELQNQLEVLAPEKIKVPSGSRVKIKYSQDGELPVLEVRLQEVFGLLDSPKVNEGNTPLMVHLLSPGFKPVQITGDLRSFWENAYFEVKKELKRRYPKHQWPENPLEAEAVRGVKRRGK